MSSSNTTTGPIPKVYYKQSADVGGDASWTSYVKVFPVTKPAATLVVGGSSDLLVELREGSYTVQSLNHTEANVPYSFVRPLNPYTSAPLSVHLGDMSIRLRAASATDNATDTDTDTRGWSTFDSTYLGNAVAGVFSYSTHTIVGTHKQACGS